ncbi:His/Gly/Thr/Pro-type tRNA ligase C-terminal domain-containing protein [Paenibacillus sp. N1-5-1-14]|uniref:His/Gly/Thr/Pro-type tRNA ligase C-terminal domain-containing protein n=1 Tax=Paenibacillus radicibacter TaxID=2972488 RepID=UPI002158E6C2|nr:His/Gly/Thr/Pro-type tRNA ligase C-terminal domain-containing protein [Paenibacillus radicibacter]MCR8644302.1 His/Gly/Thr/Pro-type tRNA ligase C-terminal domain-containing protein [Paenibacillus radicibacter]
MELITMGNPTFESIVNTYAIPQTTGALEVLALQELLSKLGLGQICKFDPFLSRGLSFYTGTVYEVFDATNGYKSSIGAGGRYDAIIGQLVGREDMAYPTVGISFGMESIMEMISNRPFKLNEPSVLVIPIGETTPSVLQVAAELRSNGIRTRTDTSRRKLKNSLATASAKGIRYVILIGEDEVNDDNVRLKDMIAKTEDVLSREEVIVLLCKTCC